jgi:uncharacterized membrane protein
MKIILLVVVIIVLFIILDLVWFQLAGGFFKSQISSIVRLTESGAWNLRYFPALLVYVLMALGIMVFVLSHATSLQHALLLGAFFGLVGYGLYDLTNLATLSAWTVKFAVVDMAWGTFLCGVVSGAAYWLSRMPFFS